MSAGADKGPAEAEEDDLCFVEIIKLSAFDAKALDRAAADEEDRDLVRCSFVRRGIRGGTSSSSSYGSDPDEDDSMTEEVRFRPLPLGI